MLITEDKEIDIFLASKIGSFKHVKYHTDSTKNSKKCIENLVDIKSLQKDDSVTCMEWDNSKQTNILLGRKNQQIEIYNTHQGEVIKNYKADFGPGHIVGLGRCKRKLLAALSNGVVKIWSKKEEAVINSGGKLDRMRVCDEDPTLFATGGEENDLKIWRIGESTPIFTAKNLPHDWLQLRRPVWVSDLCFMPSEGGHLAAVCSRYGYVRLYDTRAQRRPVCNVENIGMAATCISPSYDERQVLVGFGRGQLHQVDLRNGRLDKGYKGCVGAVTSIALVKSPRLIVTVSLDRHLRVHDQQSKQMLYKQYLTSKLTCVLVQNETSTPLRNAAEVEVKEEAEIKTEDKADEMDLLFDNMETVGDNLKKKKLPEDTTQVKKMRPSAEGSTDVDLDDKSHTEDAIMKLLKSTEKQKRRIEKKKKQKRAKSIVLNA